MTTNFKLFRRDGTMYLSRRGFECKWFGVYLHRIGAPDPSYYLHDHPWSFRSFVVKGEYLEIIADTADPLYSKRWRCRRRFSFQGIRLDQCHTINAVSKDVITIVFRGKRRRPWGFYTENGWVFWENMPREDRDLTFEEIA